MLLTFEVTVTVRIGAGVTAGESPIVASPTISVALLAVRAPKLKVSLPSTSASRTPGT